MHPHERRARKATVTAAELRRAGPGVKVSGGRIVSLVDVPGALKPAYARVAELPTDHPGGTA